MTHIRQIYTLMPWWAGAPLLVLGSLAVAVLGADTILVMALAGIGAGLAALTWSKFRRRESDHVARIVYFAHPEREGHERLYDLLMGQLWISFAAIVIFASLGAAFLGPLGALLPAGVLAARNLIGTRSPGPDEVRPTGPRTAQPNAALGA